MLPSLSHPSRCPVVVGPASEHARTVAQLDAARAAATSASASASVRAAERVRLSNSLEAPQVLARRRAQRAQHRGVVSDGFVGGRRRRCMRRTPVAADTHEGNSVDGGKPANAPVCPPTSGSEPAAAHRVADDSEPSSRARVERTRERQRAQSAAGRRRRAKACAARGAPARRAARRRKTSTALPGEQLAGGEHRGAVQRLKHSSNPPRARAAQASPVAPVLQSTGDCTADGGGAAQPHERLQRPLPATTSDGRSSHRWPPPAQLMYSSGTSSRRRRARDALTDWLLPCSAHSSDCAPSGTMAAPPWSLSVAQMQAPSRSCGGIRPHRDRAALRRTPRARILRFLFVRFSPRLNAHLVAHGHIVDPRMNDSLSRPPSSWRGPPRPARWER